MTVPYQWSLPALGTLTGECLASVRRPAGTNYSVSPMFRRDGESAIRTIAAGSSTEVGYAVRIEATPF